VWEFGRELRREMEEGKNLTLFRKRQKKKKKHGKKKKARKEGRHEKKVDRPIVDMN